MTLRRIFLTTLACVFPLLAACEMIVEHEEHIIDENVHSVILDVDSANFSVSGISTGSGFVDATMRYHDERPELDIRTQDGVLYIDYECARDDGEIEECNGDIDVFVQPGVRVVGSARSGNANVADILGPISIHSRSGNIHVSDAAGDLDLQAGSGNIRATNVTGDVIEAIAESGNVIVDAVTVPRGLRAETTSGNVTVDVPAATYRLSLATRSGNAEVSNLEDSPDATSLIYARTRSGNISVRGR